jgi:hypothetical protein
MFSVSTAESRTQDQQVHQHQQPVVAPSYHFVITAEIEPSVLMRVLELFALRNIVPSRVESHLVEDSEAGLRIAVSATGIEQAEAENLALRMRNIMPVSQVMLDWT